MSGKAPSTETASAIEVVTVVVYLLGGTTKAVHTEDVAIRANQMAPGRFVWRKYPEHIDLQAVRFALENAKREHCGYLIGTGNEGWMLATAGVEFAQENVARFQSSDLSGERLSESEKKWIRRERARLVSSDAYGKLRCGNAEGLTNQDISGFFRLDEYVTGAARERKIARIVNAFHNDPELGEAVTMLAELVKRRNWNDG